MDESQWIRGESGEDIGMELLHIKEGACLENWSSKVGSHRDEVSCSCIKTGWKLCGLT